MTDILKYLQLLHLLAFSHLDLNQNTHLVMPFYMCYDIKITIIITGKTITIF